MKLRSKTFFVVGVIMLAMVMVLVGFSSLVLEQGYISIEDKDCREKIERIVVSLEDREMQLDRSAKDWAEWDATYQYAADRNQDFETTNLDGSVFDTLQINAIAIVDVTDTLVNATFYDLDTFSKASVPQQFLDHLVPGDRLLGDVTNRSGVTGLIDIDGKALMISSHPIFTSLIEGPSRGHLIMGRYLDNNEVGALEKLTGSTFTTFPASYVGLDLELNQQSNASIMNGEVHLQSNNDSIMNVFAAVKDIYGAPALVIRAEVPRDVYNQGQITLGYLYSALIIIGFMFTLVAVLFIEHFITSRVRRLDEDVAVVRDERSFSKRVRTTGKDELSTLSVSINQMLDNLEGSETEVRKSEDRYRMVVEDQTDLICRIDRDMNITFANGQFCSYFGKEPTSVIGSSSLLHIHPDDRSEYVMTIQSLIGGHNVLTEEIRVIDKTGLERVQKLTCRGISEGESSQEVQIVGNDVTERKQAEEELSKYRENLEEIVQKRTSELLIMNRVLEKEIKKRNEAERGLQASEERYRELVNNQGEGIVLVDNVGKVTFSNPAADDLFGVQTRELVGRKVEDFTDEDGVRQMRAEMALGKSRSNYRWTLIRPDGTKRTLLVTTTPRMGLERDLLGTFAIFRDVTDNDRMEQALRKREAEYRAVVEDQTDLIVRMLPDMTLTFVNGAFYRFFGRQMEDLIGKVFTLDVTEKENMILGETITGLRPDRPTKNQEIRMVRSDGELRWMQMTFRGLFDSEGRLQEVQCVGRDVSERIQMEQEILRGQKLESIGTLAGGIAHDFNNVLTSIIGNVSLIKMRLGAGDPLMARLSEAESEIIRAKKLTDMLLTFSKGGEPIKEAQDIRDVVPEAIGSGLAGTSIRSKLDYAPNLYLVAIDKGQIVQALSNLIRNASDAMEGRGEVQIRASNLVLEHENGHPEGKYVMISVTDHGPGITPENMVRMFDPYFTTKGEGKGLGLSTALSIVKRHGGWIDVETAVGKGTTFNIVLPSAASELPEVVPTKEHQVTGSKILLMDDEEAILDVGKELLEANGFRVETAKDGREAIDLYIAADKKGEKFDVVIMDLTIRGGMGGKEAIVELLKYDPLAVAIVSSGYSNDPVMAEHLRFGFSGVVQKPYLIREMVESIRMVTARISQKADVKKGRDP